MINELNEMKRFGLRPPYINETAAEYYNRVITPFLNKSTVGYAGKHTTTSYHCYHWFQEPSDENMAIIHNVNFGEKE